MSDPLPAVDRMDKLTDHMLSIINADFGMSLSLCFCATICCCGCFTFEREHTVIHEHFKMFYSNADGVHGFPH